MPELARILATLAQNPGEPAALATLVHLQGSSYRRPGARLLLLANGLRTGSISGGCLEDDIVLRAQRVLTTGKPELATYDTTSENDLVWGVGLGCQGVVRIFIEPIPVSRPVWIAAVRENLRSRRPTELIVTFGGQPSGTGLAEPAMGRAGPLGPPSQTHVAPSGPALPPTHNATFFRETLSAPPALVIFGAGDDARPLVRFAKETGWHVTVVDARSAYATTARFPEADAVHAAPAAVAAQQIPDGESAFAVIMTHRYAEDLQLLRQLLPLPLAYIGLLGPRKRTDRLLAQLQTEGFTSDAPMLARLHAPIGLDLGGSTPETVALSIIAELQTRLTGHVPVHHRDRHAPIHG